MSVISTCVLSLVLAVTIPGAVFPLLPAQSQSGKIFGLGASALVDSQGTAYISTPDGAISAIKLDSGAPLWTTPKGKSYRPLAISGNFLVAMQEGGPSKSGKQLGLALLQLADGGEHLVNWIELPPAAWASVKNGLGAAIRTNSTTGADGRVAISWISEWQREVRGVAPDDDDETPAGGLRAAAAQLESASGSVEIDPSGQILSGRSTLSAQQFQPARQDLPEDQRLKGLPATQFVSADGNHILVSELTGNDNELNKYRWTIYSSAAKEQVGVIASPFPTASFFVSGSTIIYQLRPYAVREQGDRMVRSPLKLVAFDLRSGGKLWEQALLDTEYYGPYPQ